MIKETMRIAMYYNNQDIRLEEIPTPHAGPGELLVKVMASGICGSDVLEWYRIKKAPRVLGHEITGEIVGVGEGVDGYQIGERVFVSHHVPCNECHYCLNGYHTLCDTLRSTNFDPGGFAQYIRVPPINVKWGVFPLPEKLSFEEGVFIEPLACVVRGQRLAGIRKNQVVLIIGSGVSGMLHAALARLRGAKLIIATDINNYRLKLARGFGIDTAIPAGEDVCSQIKGINENRLADRVIVCAGSHSALTQALRCVDRGGTVLFFAPMEPGVSFPLPFYDFWYNGITLIPSYGGSPFDIDQAIDLLQSCRIMVKNMITHRLSLADTAKGFKLVAEANKSLKIVIRPNEKE